MEGKLSAGYCIAGEGGHLYFNWSPLGNSVNTRGQTLASCSPLVRQQKEMEKPLTEHLSHAGCPALCLAPCLICGSTCDRFTFTTSFCVLLLQVFLVFSLVVFLGSLCVTLALWEKSLGFPSYCIIDSWLLKPDIEVCVFTPWFHLHSSWMCPGSSGLQSKLQQTSSTAFSVWRWSVISMPLVPSNVFA